MSFATLVTQDFIASTQQFNFLLIYRPATESYELQMINSADRSRMTISHDIFCETINPDYLVWVVETSRLMRDAPLNIPKGLTPEFVLRLETAYDKGRKARRLKKAKAEQAEQLAA